MLKSGSKSIAFSIDEDIEVRGSYFFSPNWSWLLGIGYQQLEYNADSNLTEPYNEKVKIYSISTGARYYFYKNEVNFFTEGLLSYLHFKNDDEDVTQKGTSVDLNVGVEYFIAEPLSISGTVGLNYKYTKMEVDDSQTSTQKQFSTLQSALQVNFYF
jgi:outer membrane receptor protein involved in Fe transport